MNMIIGIIATTMAVFLFGHLTGMDAEENRIQKECSKHAQVNTKEYTLVCFKKPIERGE